MHWKAPKTDKGLSNALWATAGDLRQERILSIKEVKNDKIIGDE